MTKQDYIQFGERHLESEVLKKMHRRIVKSFMDILILAELRNGPMSGYDVIAFVHNKFGILVSSGTIYSLLYSLEREDMIKSRVKGTRRHYYPSSMPLPFEDGGELHEIERLLIDTVRSDPGRPVKLLAEELAVSSQLALYHLRKLSQKGYLRLERKGLSLRVYPATDRNS